MERYQGLLAQQAANKLFDTLIEGDDYGDALASFLATRISPERLGQMLANCPRPRGASSIGSGQTSSSTHSTQQDMLSFRFHGPRHSNECEIDFRPGGWALLAEFMTVEHGQHFEAVFATLSLAEKQQAFRNLAFTIAKTVEHLDLVEDDEQLKLPAESFTEDREPLQAA